MPLPINIEDLLSARTVESNRIEFKEGWNPIAIYRTICAFANDFDNTGGGYIFVGVEEQDGVAKRPVKGLSPNELADIQRKMIGFNNLIEPVYSPKLYIETVDERQILILWVPGGSNRPYQVPENITASQKRYFFYIRRYANSIKANPQDSQELIALANQVPFDDRVNTQASIDDISMPLVINYLLKVKSRLSEVVGKQQNKELLEQMELVSGPPEHIFPKNVGLMLFAEEPHLFFPSTQVDPVYFPQGEAEPFTEYHSITGPIPEQIKRTLNFLKSNFLEERITKPKDKAESTRFWNYPLQAIEETLVNAFYHRDYQVREPIEIRIYPGSIIFINYGGPDRSIQLEAFQTGRVRPRRYRNRRLGDFLKELDLTEGRATGIPTILKVLRDNGSPHPRFNTDDDRTFFEVEIFIHPAFLEPLLPVEIESWNDLKDIDQRVTQMLALAPYNIRDKVRDIAGDEAGDIAEKEMMVRIQRNNTSAARDIVRVIDRDIVNSLVIDTQHFINEKLEKILNYCQLPQKRKNVLKEIGLVNNVKNYDTYVAPLVQMGWVAMTLPDKPTSPKQQYRTTLKGNIITELLNYIEGGA